LRAMAIRWQNAGSDAKSLICRVSSAVEQRFCKPQAGGSIPSPGTTPSSSFNPLFYHKFLLHAGSTQVQPVGTGAQVGGIKLSSIPPAGVD
jgi:hypothetical protein